VIRDAVRHLVILGPLPSESDDATSEEHLQQLQDALERISRPVTDEEAELLLGVFGDDGCFGLAWALLHLIETAPHTPVHSAPPDSANEWIRDIWARAQRAQSWYVQFDHRRDV